MAGEHLREMGLAADQVTAAADFLEAYAGTCLLESGLTEPIPPIGAVSPSEPDRDPEDTSWVPVAEAATALREAGQWMLLLDPPRARDLLARSGNLYSNQGYGYGTFLLAATGWTPQPPAYEPFASWIPAISAAIAGRESLLPAPLQHPQQQVYAALAGAGLAPVAEQYRSFLEGAISSSQSGVVPVGAVGTPVRTFWDIAKTLLSETPLAGALTVALHVEAMAQRYRESMTLAQVNNHLWTNVAAPVDVGDVDIAGITAIAARRFGLSVMEAVLNRPDSPQDNISRAAVDAGLDLARSMSGS
jgi:hypothetical protein